MRLWVQAHIGHSRLLKNKLLLVIYFSFYCLTLALILLDLSLKQYHLKRFNFQLCVANIYIMYKYRSYFSSYGYLHVCFQFPNIWWFFRYIVAHDFKFNSNFIRQPTLYKEYNLMCWDLFHVSVDYFVKCSMCTWKIAFCYILVKYSINVN